MLGMSTHAVTNYLNIIFCRLHVLLPEPCILNSHISDFSSNSLILALHQCFARRGTPTQIISDNFKTLEVEKYVILHDLIEYSESLF